MLKTLLTVTCRACAESNERGGGDVDQDFVLIVTTDDEATEVLDTRIRSACYCEEPAEAVDDLLLLERVREVRGWRSAFGTRGKRAA